MLVTAIIVNYNVKYLVYQCVRSLLRSTLADQVEIFVVDNASTDGSETFLRTEFPTINYPQVHLIFSRENIGFGRANNLALAQAKGEYVLFINPDTIVTEHTLNDCYTFAKQHSNLGALGVYMMNDDGRYAPESKRGIPTPLRAFFKLIGLVALCPKHPLLGQYYLGHLSAHTSAPIEVVSGAYMWVSQKALRVVGGFDEAFFMYGEDIDLSYRLLQSGYTNYYFPTPILHYKGESTVKTSWRYVQRFYEAMLIFYTKHFKHHHALTVWSIKGAIITSGLFALIRHKLLRRTPSWEEQRSYLFVVTKASRQIAEALASKHQLDAIFSTLETWQYEPQLNERNYIVFDAEASDYTTMIHYLHTRPAKQKLATLYPSRALLITQQHIYTL